MFFSTIATLILFHNRYNLETRPDLKALFEEYRNDILGNNYHYFKPLKCFYLNNEKAKKIQRNLENFLRQALPLDLKHKIKRLINIFRKP